MRWWVVACACVGVGCGGEPPACGTSIAEAVFVETALDAHDHAFGPPAQATAACPGGGSSTVEGTSSASQTSPRVDDYKVTFSDCATLDAAFTFNGMVTLSGTWLGDMNAAYCDTCKVTADALTIRGTEERCDDPHIERTCKVSFTVKGTAANVPQRYAGSICDFTFP